MTVLVTGADELTAALGPHQSAGERLALVPTMGALHAGHASLIEAARERAARVAVSIFVNPLQFRPGEDLDRYPRDLTADVALCREHGADVVFAPSVVAMYPAGSPEVTVDPGPLGAVLEGESRPGHFRGVLTVVAKLFAMSRPDMAVFGEKDYQQLVLIRRMVSDLSMGVDVVGAATVRDSDGLALSSRNRYLAADQREVALRLSRALQAGAAAGPAGRDAVLSSAHDCLRHPQLTLDYLALRSLDLTSDAEHGPARLLVAAVVEGTRLIDNRAVRLP